MLARLRSEFTYLKATRRILARTSVVAAEPNRTIADRSEEWAAQWGERVALKSEREELTYRQLSERANQVARWARAQGLKKGDAICLMMPNRPEYIAIWLGMARAGLITALINTNLAGPALAHCIAISAAKAFIIDAALLPQFEMARALIAPEIAIFAHGPSPDAAPRIDMMLQTISGASLSGDERCALTIEDGALYVFTSGTTGLPKAARITHSRLLRIMFGFSAVLDAKPSDRMYIAMPMYHSNGGIIAPGAALSAGGSCFIREKFSANEFWRDIVAAECTLFVYVGELCRYLLNAPPTPLDKAHKVRACVGNGLRPDIFVAFQRRFGIADIREFYGATEGNIVLFNMDSWPGSVGRIPRWAAKRFPIKIVAYDVETGALKRDAKGHCCECANGEPGELISQILNDPKMPAARFDGYADKAATEQKILRNAFVNGDAWFRTGDLLAKNAHGYFFFIDRIGDTFRWKGENVSTTEVAEAIAVFPGVRDVSVYGVESPGADGRAGMAALNVEDPQKIDLVGLRAHIAAHLPIYARPVFLRLKNDLELTGTFKQKKTTLMAEGFDTTQTADPIFFDDRILGAYRRIADDFADQIRRGVVKI